MKKMEKEKGTTNNKLSPVERDKKKMEKEKGTTNRKLFQVENDNGILESQIKSLKEEYLNVNKKQDSILEFVECPITSEKFEVPVITPGGITYEKKNYQNGQE